MSSGGLRLSCENLDIGLTTLPLQHAEGFRTRLASPREFLIPKEGARKEWFMKASHFGKAFVAILVACLFVTVGIHGQVGTTSIRGVVTDKTGAAIVGAKVSLASTAQALQRQMATSPAGEHDFRALPPATYVSSVN